MLKIVKTLQQIQSKQHKKLSPVAIKKVVKTVEGLGFMVTGVKAAPDGSFFVETAKVSEDENPANYWDKVLAK